LALDIVAGGLEKKALNCEVIDVRGRVDYADFLVIMTGRSDRHVASIAQGIESELAKKGIAAISIEGMTASTWVLLDYSDVVVHVFVEDARQLYDIEGLWMDAGRISVPEEEGQTASRAVPVEAEDDAEDAEDEDDEDDEDEDDADDDDADDEDEDEDDSDVP
jgi:ribosome-associated protein